MDDNLIKQLAELAKACQRKEVKPIICGGLSVYLSFCHKEGEINHMIRATRDIDLMLSKQDLLEKAKRKAIAEIITDELKYIVQPEKKYHGLRRVTSKSLTFLSLLLKVYRFVITDLVLSNRLYTDTLQRKQSSLMKACELFGCQKSQKNTLKLMLDSMFHLPRI